MVYGRGKKFIYMLCCIVFAVFVLSGCGARIDVYEESGDEGTVFCIDVCLDNALNSKLVSSAAENPQTGKKWSVGSWLEVYMQQLSQLYGFTYVYVGVLTDSSHTEMLYRFKDIKATRANEYLSSALTLKGDRSVGTNLFIRTVKVERDDRFNYFINEYKDAYSRLTSGKPLKAAGETAMGVFLFGIRYVYPVYEGQPNHPDIADNPDYKYDPETGEVYKTVLPGFGEAFGADLSDYAQVKLRNLWHVTARMAAESTDTANVNIDGEKKFYYVFCKTVGDGDTTVKYRYWRADPTGWYVVAVLCGGIAVLVTVLVARRKKRKAAAPPPPKPQDDYPYDPFDGNIDPFA